MTKKGLIFSAQKDSKTQYQAAPFVIGIYEFQVNRLTDGFLKDLGDYWSTVAERDEPKTMSAREIIEIVTRFGGVNGVLYPSSSPRLFAAAQVEVFHQTHERCVLV